MKKLFLLLFMAGCGFSPDCAKLDDTYEKVVASCGKNAKHKYRNGKLDSILYSKGKKSLFVGFDGDTERVDQIYYKDDKQEIKIY